MASAPTRNLVDQDEVSDYRPAVNNPFDQNSPSRDSEDSFPASNSPTSPIGSMSMDTSMMPSFSREPQDLTFLNGLAILLGLQIGSGIFSVPSQVSQHVPSPAVGVAAWIVGGLLVWTGVASFIELGLAITGQGGIQEYLRCCYGNFAAFLFTSAWVGVARPCGMAIVATVFADHVCQLLFSKAFIGLALTKLVGILAVLSIAAINCAGARTGVKVANLFLTLKLGALISIILLGIIGVSTGQGQGVGSEGNNHGWFDSPDKDEIPPWTLIGNLVTALFGALFCYNGWESIGFVAADLANPARDLPRILMVGLAIVTVGFTLTNVSLYLILSFENIRSHYTVVIQFASQLLGISGVVIYSIIVALSCLGAINANLITTSALCMAASDRGYFPRIFSNRSYSALAQDTAQPLQTVGTWSQPFQSLAIYLERRLNELRTKTNAPVYPVLLNSLLACVYIAVGTFNGLIVFIGISEYLFFFFVIMGVFVIRSRHNSLQDSTPAFRTWSGNPIIFCTVSAFVVIQGIIKNYLQGIAILVAVGVGWIWFRKRVYT